MYLTSKLLSQNLSIKIPIFSTFVARFLQFNSSVSQVPSLIVPMHLCFLCNMIQNNKEIQITKIFQNVIYLLFLLINILATIQIIMWMKIHFLNAKPTQEAINTHFLFTRKKNLGHCSIKIQANEAWKILNLIEVL